MSAPEKTTLDAIVAAGRELVEQRGIDGLTMQAVAERVGVRAPSLYKRVQNRRDLLALVVSATMDDLIERIGRMRAEPDPRRRLAAQANGLRAFAHERPIGFSLVFGAHSPAPPDPEATGRSVAPLLDAVIELTGPEHALDGARLVVAWANGFLTMELAGAFRLGADVDTAWNWGLERIVASLDSEGSH